jgi:adenylate kinase
MRSRGEEVRVDDTPEVLTKRLASYRALTEPLIHYYSERRKLLTVDGMMTIEHVTQEIDRILAAIGAVETGASRRAGSARPAANPAKPAARKASRKASKSARGTGSSPKKAARAAGRVSKPASKGTRKGAKKTSRKVSAGSRKRPVRRVRKVAKKVTKRRAKA